MEELAKARKLPLDLLRRYVVNLPGGGVRFVYRLEDGQEAPVWRIRLHLEGDKGLKWGRGDRPIPFGLDRLQQAREWGGLILLEGETDALTAWAHGLPALGIPGANQAGTLEAEHLRGVSRLWVWREPDEGGRVFVRGVARRLGELGWRGTAAVLELPGYKDLNELQVATGGDRDAFHSAFEEAVKSARLLEEVVGELEDTSPVVDVEERAGEPQLDIVCLSDVEPQSTEWHWPGFLPVGELVLMAGDPGVGKSFAAMAIAAAFSTGAPLPGCTEGREGVDVLLLTLEDDESRVVRPRLEALGADLRRIHVVRGVRQGGAPVPLLLPEHVEHLRRAIEKTGARLCVIDPLVGVLPGTTDTHRQAAVRAAVSPLQRLAHETGCTILAIAHLRKGEGPALYRPNASIDFVAMPRVVLGVGRTPDDPNLRAVAVVKSNLGEIPEAVGFRIVGGRLEWEAERLHLEADDVLSPPRGREGGDALCEAEEFLREVLRNGPLTARDIFKAAARAGISEITLRRAKTRLGIRAIPAKDEKGRTHGWKWELPPSGWPDDHPDDQPIGPRDDHLDFEPQNPRQEGHSVQMII